MKKVDLYVEASHTTATKIDEGFYKLNKRAVMKILNLSIDKNIRNFKTFESVNLEELKKEVKQSKKLEAYLIFQPVHTKILIINEQKYYIFTAIIPSE